MADPAITKVPPARVAIDRPAPSTPPDPIARNTPRLRRGRGLRRFGSGLDLFGGLPVAAVLLLLWLGATQSGLRTLVGLISEAAPDVVHVERVEGRLLGRATLDGITVRLSGIVLRIDRLELQVAPIAAIAGTLRVADLHAQHLDLHLAETAHETGDPVVLPPILLPLRLELGRALIAPLRVFQGDAETPWLVFERAELAGTLDEGTLEIEHLAVALRDPPFELAGQGQVRLSGAYPIALDLHWQTRPAPDARLLGHTRLDGDLTRLDARNTLTGSADLDLDIELSNLLDRPDWNGRLQIYALDLPAFNPALPRLALSGALATRGGADAVELSGDLAGESPEHPAIGRLAGTLDLLWQGRTLHVRGMEIGRGDTGLRVSGLGRIAFRGTTAHIDGFSVRSGRSVLSIDGTFARTLDLRLGLDAPDLASLYPGVGGRVRATATLAGRPAEPRLTLDLDARNLAIAGQTAAALSAVADLDLAPGGRFKLQADGRDLRLGDPGGDPGGGGGGRWQALSVRGEGRRADHRLGLSLTGEPLSVRLDLSGGLLETGIYRGRLTDLRLDSPLFEVWTLRRPSPIELTWPAITAGPVCLDHGNGSGGCVALARTTTADWTLGIDLDRLDLGLLAPLLPEGLSLEGVAAVEGRFAAAGTILSGRGSASLATARLGVVRARGQIVDLSGARLDVDSGPAGLRAKLALPVRDLGRADADLHLPGWRPENPSGSAQPLDGRLLVSFDGLEHLGDLIPQISRMRGAVRADIALSGTLGAPDLRGNARIERAGFNVPLLGLDVEGLNLRADAVSANRIQVSGAASMGTGRLEIGGNAAFGPAGPEARIQAVGEGLRLIDTGEYVVSVSPRLDLEATATGARLRGEILIPEARIRPRALPEGTVRASGDVVIKGMDRPPVYPVDLAVELRLGDAVSLDAFGLSGRLAGALSLSRPPGRALSGNGRLQINDGRYRIPTRFGPATDLIAPLTITRGELVWVMSPIRNPGLLISARRSAGRTAANLRVLGTLADPRLAFFSDTDPTMTQAEATTFLVTGIPPGGNGGLDTALAFGRYIAPGTFLEYVTGIGATRNRFSLSRNLTDRLQLEASSGGSPAVDLFWTFERD